MFVKKHNLIGINPIAADTGLWLMPEEYERKAGLTLIVAQQNFSKVKRLMHSIKSPYTHKK